MSSSDFFLMEQEGCKPLLDFIKKRKTQSTSFQETKKETKKNKVDYT
jgi:hypothetical protein